MRGVVHTLHTARYARFAAAVMAMRKRAGLSQRELARRLGRTQAYVGKSELSERRLDVLELHDWCQACGESLPEFIQRIEL